MVKMQVLTLNRKGYLVCSHMLATGKVLKSEHARKSGDKIVPKKFSYKTPVQPACRYMKAEATNNFPWNLVAYQYRRALHTPADKWNQSMVAAYFWTERNHPEALLLTVDLVGRQQNMFMGTVYKLARKYPRYIELAKANPVLAVYLAKAYRSSKKIQKGIGKLMRCKQQTILNVIGEQWNTPVSHYDESGLHKKNVKLSVLKKWKGKDSNMLEWTVRPGIEETIDKLPFLHNTMLTVMSSVPDLEISFRRFNTNMWLELDNRTTKTGLPRRTTRQKTEMLEDISRMMRECGDESPTLPDRFNSWQQVQQYHDTILEIMNHRVMAQNSESYGKQYDLLLPGNENIIPLLSRIEIEMEGKKMHHCVGSYWRYAEQGDTGIYHVVFDGEEATLSIKHVKKEYSFMAPEGNETYIAIDQLHGPCNHQVSPKLAAIVREWAKEHSVAESRY